mmetsp:Transcript_15305/g.26510  ORF Transcript_15305/g.26510 Transcript_15305/m.26510 type:complete len:138 (+) Transcript_15305:333-746(+)
MSDSTNKPPPHYAGAKGAAFHLWQTAGARFLDLHASKSLGNDCYAARLLSAASALTTGRVRDFLEDRQPMMTLKTTRAATKNVAAAAVAPAPTPAPVAAPSVAAMASPRLIVVMSASAEAAREVSAGAPDCSLKFVA